MGVDAGVPPGLWERIRSMISEEVGKLLKSGLLRNASISDGGLTIKGGFFRLKGKVSDAFDQFYLGPVGGTLADGNVQQWWRVKRADGTTVLRLWDAFPDAVTGSLNQALSWIDRSGNPVFADDTDSGQGIARPFVPAAGYPAQSRHWPDTASGSFETLYRARMPKQQPKLLVKAWGTCSGSGVTGEIAVFVNDVQLGSTQSVNSSLVQEFSFGPEPVTGSHMQELNVELRARVTGGAGSAYTCFSWVQGQQT